MVRMRLDPSLAALALTVLAACGSSQTGGTGGGGATTTTTTTTTTTSETSSQTGTSSQTTNSSACGVVPSGLACVPFSASELLVAGTSCPTEDVHQFIVDCWDSATSSPGACAPWAPDGARGQTACGVCLNGWTNQDGMPNLRACTYRFLGGTDATEQERCRNAFKCFNACAETTCSTEVCDDVTKDSSGNTEYDRCFSLDSLFGAGGACMTLTSDGAAIGTTANACVADAAFRAATENCKISSSRGVPIVTQLEYFYRGACRDGGVWTGASTP